MEDRKTFLIEMYKQMFADINRHMTVVWQAVSVVVGAFAVLALVEKQVIPIDIAVSLIVILCGWLYLHMIDGAYWYNRNLVIIANIERQFLVKSDLKDIQYYFGEHRSVKNRMISYFRVQAWLGIAIATLVLLFHFSTRVFPGFSAEMSSFEFSRSLPYLAAIGSLIFCWWFAWDRQESYKTFRKNSPGIQVDTSGIDFGRGHTTDKKENAPGAE
jgi:hypothetical protein